MVEIGFLKKKVLLANPVLDIMNRMSGPSGLEAKFDKLPEQEMKKAKEEMTSMVNNGYYNITQRKQRMKEVVEK